MSSPLASIIVLAYNQEKYLEQCLNSLMAQECDFSFEIIVADDASTDGTREIIKRFSQSCEFIVPQLNDKNLGVNENFKLALSKVRGEFIAFCEGDDFWVDDSKLSVHVNELNSNTDISIVYSNYKIVDSENRLLRNNALPNQRVNLQPIDLIDSQGPATFTMTVRKSIFPNDFPREFYKVLNPDVFLFAWALIQGNSLYVNKVQAAYRKHDGGIWSTKGRREKHLIRFHTLCLVYRSLGLKQETEIARKKLEHHLALAKDENKELYTNYLSKFSMIEKVKIKLKEKYFQFKSRL